MEETVSVEQNYWDEVDIGKLGIWLFLLSEIMLFGAFLSGYVMLRWGSTVCALGSPAWPKAGYTSGLALALLNTIVLITSSFTMVRTFSASLTKQEESFRKNLLWTISLGTIFLLVKLVEYSLKIEHGYTPGSSFMAANPGLTIFVSFYFALTGLHALHVVAGVLWNFFLLQAHKVTGITERLTKKIEYAGLYWHFVDIIWVFLFPLFYLI